VENEKEPPYTLSAKPGTASRSFKSARARHVTNCANNFLIERLSETIDILPDAAFAVDREGRVIAWNRAVEALTGVPKSKILGKGGYAYEVPFHGKAKPGIIDAAMGAGISVESHYTGMEKYGDTCFAEVFCPCLDGGRGAFLWAKASPVHDSEGNLLGAVECIRDLTARKKSEETLRNLIRKKVTAIAFEKIRDQSGEMPYIESMSEISGITSLLIASEYLSNLHGGKGVLLGGIAGITPTEVVIIGANTAGESASRAALGLGATVKIFDNSIPKLRMIQNALGQRLQTSVFHPQVLKKALKSADVLIGAMELDDMQPIYHVTEEMVRSMKKGAIVIDLSNTGGCIETTECRFMRGPVYEKAGITHFSAWNLPSRVARTASIAASNIFTPLLQRMADAGGLNQLLKYDQGVRKGAYLYNGLLTNATLGLKFGIISKDLDLLITAF
jgi:alanine dehydrogenase